MSKARSVLNALTTGFFLLLESPVRPRWAYHRARGFLFHYVLNRFHKRRLEEYQTHLEPLTQAVASITGRTEDEVRGAGDSDLLRNMVVHNRWVVALNDADEAQSAEGADESPIEVFYGPSPQFMELVHTICRLLEPEVVVESGVAKGFISTAVLDALEQNGRGKLYSLDMPSLHVGFAAHLGEAIPARLRERWTLELGPSALVLPRIIREVGAIDVFIYDSAISYDTQSTDFQTAIRAMRPGGVLIANLVTTDALVEVAEAHGCNWATTPQTKAYPLGLLAKPK